jgi:hypothetical protein
MHGADILHRYLAEFTSVLSSTLFFSHRRYKDSSTYTVLGHLMNEREVSKGSNFSRICHRVKTEDVRIGR